MGIPGVLKEIGKGDRVALAKLAFDHFEEYNRPLRIAIDAAIWNFQTQYGGQGGKNPALRTLYFRLLRLLGLPIHPVFVYDGKNKPLTKRGKTVSRYGSCVPVELSKNLVARFQFPHHVAPGEAEAECAFLQKHGIVDAVMSQDADAIMFGSTLTLRDWSKEGTRGNKAPTHVNVLDAVKIREQSGLDAVGMILVALFSGGDYHEGIAGFGPGLSCQIARAGFGQELVELVQADDEEGLQEWRQRLQYELESNESGFFQKRHKTIKVPDDFPNRTVLTYYLNPAVSKQEDLKKLERRWLQWWDKDIDIPALRTYVAMTFDWLYKKGATYFIRSLAQPLFQHRLRTMQVDSNDFTYREIRDQRKHFTTGGVCELRVPVVPADVVGIDLDAEEENPELFELGDEVDEDGPDVINAGPSTNQDTLDEPSTPSNGRKRPPWDPSATEKWWVPEPLLRTGLPEFMREWDLQQEAIRTDPIMFLTRKCKATAKSSKKIDRTMRDGALDALLPAARVAPRTVAESESTRSRNLTTNTRKCLSRSRSNPLTATTAQDRNILAFFRPAKASAKQQSQAQFLKVDSTNSEDLTHDLFVAATQPTANVVSARVKTSASGSSIGQLIDSRPQELEASDDEHLSSLMRVSRLGGELAQSKTIPVNRKTEPEPAMLDVEIPPSVTQRRNRDIRPPPAKVSQARTASDRSDKDLVDIFLIESACSSQSKPSFLEPVAGAGRVTERSSKVDCQSRAPVSIREAMQIGSVKKVAASRESLPGTWKAVPLTPLQSSKLKFVDLSNMS